MQLFLKQREKRGITLNRSIKRSIFFRVFAILIAVVISGIITIGSFGRVKKASQEEQEFITLNNAVLTAQMAHFQWL